MKTYNNEILIYQTEDGVTKINVNMQNETVWLSKAQMAELFQRDRSVISKHIKKVFEEGEHYVIKRSIRFIKNYKTYSYQVC